MARPLSFERTPAVRDLVNTQLKQDRNSSIAAVSSRHASLLEQPLDFRGQPLLRHSARVVLGQGRTKDEARGSLPGDSN